MQTKKTAWRCPVIHPLPLKVEGIEEPVIPLNGEDWELNTDFGEMSGKDSLAKDGNEQLYAGSWKQTEVPGWVEAGEEAYAYRKTLHIPETWKEKRVFLRFEGVGGDARVYMGGQFVMEHCGGFVSWDCEITEQIRQGERLLTVAVCNKRRETCPFEQGGLIRDVMMFALPEINLVHFQTETVFDQEYRDSILKVELQVAGGDAKAALKIADPSGKEKRLGIYEVKEGEERTLEIPVQNPLKWDSEHPYLYQLYASVADGDQEKETAVRKIGFRQVECRGSEVYVNGERIKLRGINRHDIDPVRGRCITHEQVEEDIRLFKEANINFIRTSHYPPRSDFLELCDAYGIYVEEEAAVAFIGYGTERTQDDPVYAERYLMQISSMIERDKYHPSVIIWSLGNESVWGKNISRMNAYVHEKDAGRLTIFSYPMTQMETDTPADIWSVHYGNWDSDLAALTECFKRSYHDKRPWPVLHDESTHIPCYDREELRRDPGVRDFWGETVCRFWKRIWETDGALGCAIWAGIDDVRVQTDPVSGQPFSQSGPVWGIMDGWRRLKPEYWNVKKGYSPIHLTGGARRTAEGLSLPVENRFNHTDFREIKICWEVGTQSGEMQGPALAPGEKGEILLPVKSVKGAKLKVRFYDAFGYPVEEYEGKAGSGAVCGTESDAAGCPAVLWQGAPEVEETADAVVLKGDGCHFTFSGRTGLLQAGYSGEKKVLTGGPYLHLTGLPLASWRLEEKELLTDEEKAVVRLRGSYGRVKVEFVICIDRKGRMETEYTITEMPYPSPRSIAVSSSITSHSGGYSEVGIYYTVSHEMDRLSWKRRGRYSTYPEGHIARLEGTAYRRKPQGIDQPGIRPEWGWEMDEKDWALFGKYDIGRRGTRDFASMKADILQAGLGDGEHVFTAVSDGTDAVRMEVTFRPENVISDRDQRVCYHGDWYQEDTAYYSQNGTEMWSSRKGDTCTLQFVGTGIAWYAGQDRICGSANVYLDGVFQEEVGLGLDEGMKSPRKVQKQYGQLVFSAEGLSMGEHVICIEVTGKPSYPGEQSYVMIDHFVILDGREIGDTKFIINSAFNYPELSWADYMKPPVKVGNGYSGKAVTAVKEVDGLFSAGRSGT